MRLTLNNHTEPVQVEESQSVDVHFECRAFGNPPPSLTLVIRTDVHFALELRTLCIADTTPRLLCTLFYSRDPKILLYILYFSHGPLTLLYIVYYSRDPKTLL